MKFFFFKKKYKKSLNVIVTTSRQIAEGQKIVMYVRELIFLNQGVRIPYYSTVTGGAKNASSDEIKMR